MKLGNKIRKYRQLNDMSQKELGMKAGFSAATADSRMRKYESGVMAPKADIRSKIASALNVDIEALSDVEVSSFADIMYILFELEEDFGLNIEKKNGKTSIVFDDSDKDLEQLISFLTAWKDKKDSVSDDPDDIHDYEVWKSHFVTDINDCYAKKEKEVDDYYKKSVSAFKGPYSDTTSEIVILLRNIVESGITLSARTKRISHGISACGFTFKVNELINPPSDEAKKLIAQFISEFQHFGKLGAKTYTDIQMPDGSFSITYYVEVSSFSMIVDLINDFIRHYESRDGQSEYSLSQFEDRFNDDLKTNNNNIEDEIRIYSQK